jgi:hypothetical protein
MENMFGSLTEEIIAALIVGILGAIGRVLWKSRNPISMTVVLIIIVFACTFLYMRVWKPRQSSAIVEQSASLPPNYYCDATTLNVRESPSANARSVGQLKKGQECYVYSYDASSSFATISFKGKKAYVSAEYLKPKDASAYGNVIPISASPPPSSTTARLQPNKPEPKEAKPNANSSAATTASGKPSVAETFSETLENTAANTSPNPAIPKAEPRAAAPSIGSVSTPARRMSVTVTRAELIENGAKFLLEFMLTNNGEDIGLYDIYGGYGSDNSMAYDNMGNKAQVYISFGNGNSSSADFARNPLPGNNPKKVTATITGFSPQATSFTRIKIHGRAYPALDALDANGDYLFKNVAIR